MYICFNLVRDEKITLDSEKIKDIENLIERGIIAGQENIEFYRNFCNLNT